MPILPPLSSASRSLRSSRSDQEASADSLESGEHTDPQSDRTEPARILMLTGGGRLTSAFRPRNIIAAMKSISNANRISSSCPSTTFPIDEPIRRQPNQRRRRSAPAASGHVRARVRHEIGEGVDRDRERAGADGLMRVRHPHYVEQQRTARTEPPPPTRPSVKPTITPQPTAVAARNKSSCIVQPPVTLNRFASSSRRLSATAVSAATSGQMLRRRKRSQNGG